MIRRTMEATALNAAANHPDVRPWLGGEGVIDLTATLGDPANVAFADDHGGFVFQRVGAGAYEAHSMITPAGRGKVSLRGAQAALRYLFTATDCERVMTRVPDGNQAADGLGRFLGFSEIFRRESVWPKAEGSKGGVSYRVLTLEAWLARDPEIANVGHVFHEQLEAAKAAAGSARETHDDEEAHDRLVGATFLMVQAGNAQKGVLFYNMWAAVLGFAPIAILSHQPVIVDVGDAIATVTGDTLEVLKCR